MLNFDELRFVSIQDGAMKVAAQLDVVVGELLDGGAKNLFFLGAGGAGMLMLPAAQILRRSTAFPVFLENAAELMALGSVNLGPESIVVIPSLSGTTREAVEVLDFAHSQGARVIALTGHADSPVALAADYNFTNSAADDTSSESFYLQSLGLALSLLHRLGAYPEYESTMAELARLPRLLVEVKNSFESRAAELAATIQNDGYHVLSGAGSTWPEAWYYGTCILEEMQWIRTRPVHASDFFHGTLELVEPGVSVILFKGEDSARALVERVEAWVPSVTERLSVIDTAVFELPGISTHVRELISHVLIATVVERLSAHLEILRNHPLTTRRYYRRVSY
jgi:fructoselysine-6-phosphate deglycase